MGAAIARNLGAVNREGLGANMVDDTDFPSWPTYPSGLDGDWIDADCMGHTDILTYREVDGWVVHAMRNSIYPKGRWTKRKPRCEAIGGDIVLLYY